MDSRFFFPADEGKEPLFSISVSCNKKDYDKLLQASLLRLTVVFGDVVMALVLLNIVVSAFVSKAYAAAAAYIILAVFLAAMSFLPVAIAKNMYKKAPYNSSQFCYNFYRHHFTLSDEYEGLSLSYDDISSATEDILMFILFTANGTSYVIPKRELESDKASMLHAVLENKLGDKLTVKAF